MNKHNSISQFSKEILLYNKKVKLSLLNKDRLALLAATMSATVESKFEYYIISILRMNGILHNSP